MFASILGILSILEEEKKIKQIRQLPQRILWYLTGFGRQYGVDGYPKFPPITLSRSITFK